MKKRQASIDKNKIRVNSSNSRIKNLSCSKQSEEQESLESIPQKAACYFFFFNFRHSTIAAISLTLQSLQCLYWSLTEPLIRGFSDLIRVNSRNSRIKDLSFSKRSEEKESVKSIPNQTTCYFFFFNFRHSTIAVISLTLQSLQCLYKYLRTFNPWFPGSHSR